MPKPTKTPKSSVTGTVAAVTVSAPAVAGASGTSDSVTTSSATGSTGRAKREKKTATDSSFLESVESTVEERLLSLERYISSLGSSKAPAAKVPKVKKDPSAYNIFRKEHNNDPELAGMEFGDKSKAIAKLWAAAKLANVASATGTASESS